MISYARNTVYYTFNSAEFIENYVMDQGLYALDIERDSVVYKIRTNEDPENSDEIQYGLMSFTNEVNLERKTFFALMKGSLEDFENLRRNHEFFFNETNFVSRFVYSRTLQALSPWVAVVTEKNCSTVYWNNRAANLGAYVQSNGVIAALPVSNKRVSEIQNRQFPSAAVIIGLGDNPVDTDVMDVIEPDVRDWDNKKIFFAEFAPG